MKAQATVVFNRQRRGNNSPCAFEVKWICQVQSRSGPSKHKKSEGLPQRQTFAIPIRLHFAENQVERAISRFVIGLVVVGFFSPSNQSSIGEAMNTVLYTPAIEPITSENAKA